jgi:hypothetical protein
MADPSPRLFHPTPPPGFDPFANREDRQIRNQLSSALIASIRERNPVYQDMADPLSARHPNGRCREYVRDRINRYDRVWGHLIQNGFQDIPSLFRWVWNQGLFFECHDLLERDWRTHPGNLRKAIKGLIQAAGAYEHMIYGRTRPAERLAGKALDTIADVIELIAPYIEPETLMAGLKALNQRPPRSERT